MTLDRFYPIFDSADWIERLVPLGIKLVQLRIKDAPLAVVRDHIRRAKSVCDTYNCTLIINDYWLAAIDEGCDYIHLGQEDLDDADIKAIRAAGLHFGISTHDKTELTRAIALHPNYVALGPIYPTILKKMKWHEQGVSQQKDVLSTKMTQVLKCTIESGGDIRFPKVLAENSAIILLCDDTVLKH